MVVNLSYSSIPLQKISQKGVDRSVENPQKRAENIKMAPNAPNKYSWRMRNKMPLCWVTMYSLFVHNINLQNAVFYEVRFAKIPVLYAHLRYKCTRFRGRPTLNDVERFGMGWSTNSFAEKPGKCAKFIMSSSHEKTNDPYASSNFEILAKL